MPYGDRTLQLYRERLRYSNNKERLCIELKERRRREKHSQKNKKMTCSEYVEIFEMYKKQRETTLPQQTIQESTKYPL